MHEQHILTSDLRQAYKYLREAGQTDSAFDVAENIPAGKNNKRAVSYHYAGKRSYPFAFIVNSGERKEYHLFYIRNPRRGDMGIVREYFDEEKLFVNNSGEITIQFRDLAEAEKVWLIVKRVQLR